MSLIIFGTRDKNTTVSAQHTSAYTLIETINRQNLSSYSIQVGKKHISQYAISNTPISTHISTYGISCSKKHSSSYCIFISNQEKEQYIISQYIPPKEHTSKYSLFVSSGFQNSKYSLLVTNKFLSSYTVYVTGNHESNYDIKIKTVSSKVHRSKYSINQKYYFENISEYKILNNNYTSANHYSIYRFLASMVRGITDRFCCQWNAWQKVPNERNIHLHLFNTFASERSIAYERYYKVFDQKDLLLERKVTFTERDITFEYYTIHDNDVLCYTGSYHIVSNDRTFACSSYNEHVDERTIIALQLFHTQTERECVWWSAYDAFRYCLAETWHVSEIWCVTHAKELDHIATQRDMWAQIDEIHFESIRQIIYDCCSLSYDLIINPIYTNFQYNISAATNVLFESTVTPDTSSYLNIPVDDNLSDVDILIIEKGNNDPYYCGRKSLINLNFKQISSRTWLFDGYLCAYKNVSFIKTVFEFINKGIYETDQEYFNYLNDHGYLKVKIGNEEMYNREVSVNNVARNTLIPFKIWALDTEIDKQNINILFKWAYPYSSLKMNEVLLVATRTY